MSDTDTGTFEAVMTQFKRPNGIQQEVHGELPVRCQTAYQRMCDEGRRLEAELVPPNFVHIEICDYLNLDIDNPAERAMLEPNNEHLSGKIADLLVKWEREREREREREQVPEFSGRRSWARKRNWEIFMARGTISRFTNLAKRWKTPIDPDIGNNILESIKKHYDEVKPK